MVNITVWPTTPGLPITSPYGWRDHPITGEWTFHGAIDIGGGGVNHPIYATMNGVVMVNQWSDSAGWLLIIKHSLDEYYSRYIHLAEQATPGVGTIVSAGEQVGIMGTTGDSTGIHLDFAIATRVDGFGTEQYTIDPEQYLAGSIDPPDPDPDPTPPDTSYKPYLYRHSTNMRRMGVRGKR